MSIFIKRSDKEMVGFRRATKFRNLGLEASRQEVSSFIKRSDKEMVGSRRIAQI